ncbi:calcium and integrin-binding family member 3-like [Acanthaster planci]|uniref:Calcium and integrin-binding family member 3-like n=1 Tax=Acanthaster planci TaxID=133434 RepID=A0A8B7XNG0_ACAPL|nr:calcium and integrin-binding family member 3-like [Acanthaster planci]
MGNADSILPPEKIAELEKRTHFKSKEIEKVLSYYAQYDRSPNGQDGIPMEDLSDIAELCGCPFFERLAYAYLERPAMNLKAEPFLQIFSFLSSRASVEEKSKALFDCLDCSHDCSLGFDELFRFYKCILNPAVDDDYIIDLVVRILERPEIKQEHRVSFEEFQKLISTEEIKEKMTVDLQLAI